MPSKNPLSHKSRRGVKRASTIVTPHPASTLTMSGSSLASVVGSHSKDLDKWTPKRIDDRDALARLHAKFWGKSMADVARDSPASTPNSTNEDKDTIKDQGEVFDDCGHGKMAVDEDESADEDDDIGPGCYFLDIGIDGLEYSKIWIRADYLRIYAYLEGHYSKVLNFPQNRAPAAVITGQPGIGESAIIALIKY
jgi:hypothetical protein